MKTDALAQADPSRWTGQDLVEVYEQQSPGLYRYAVRLLGDAVLAEDCVSATFTRLLDVLQRGGGHRGNVRAYLYTVAHNWIMDFYRRRVPEVTLEAGNLRGAPGDDPATVVSRERERQQVREALLSLTEDQRQVIMLRFYEAWSHEETAEALGKSVEATRALQHRALERLRSKLLPVRGSGETQ